MLRSNFTRTTFLVIFILGTTISAIAQLKEKNTAQWKNIDALINKGLTRSALDQVKTIYTTAKKNGNNTQLIKALLYQLHLQQNRF